MNYKIHSRKRHCINLIPYPVVAPDVAPELRNKLIFVTYDPEEEKIVSAGGNYSNGRVVATLMSFGEYAVSMDTLAPEIIPLNGSAQTNQSGRSSIRFTIRDDLSGIR